MKQTGKRVLSWALALVMVLGLAPMLAIEADADTTEGTELTAESLSTANYSLSSGNYYLSGNVTVTQAITLADSVVIDGNNHTISVTTPYLNESYEANSSPSTYGVFSISSGSATLKNMTIMGGHNSTNEAASGAVYVSGGALTMENVTVTRSGRGLCVANGTAILTNCHIDHNQYRYGAGIFCKKNLVLVHCSVSYNTTSGGGGGAMELAEGAKVYANNTVIMNNISTSNTGGINNAGSGSALTQVYLMNCNITGNTSNYSGLGGGIRTGSGVYAVNCVINNNKDTSTSFLDIDTPSSGSSYAPTLICCVYGKLTNDSRASLTTCVPSQEASAAAEGGVVTYFDYTLSDSDLTVNMGYGSANSIQNVGNLTAPGSEKKVTKYYGDTDRADGVIGATGVSGGATYTVTFDTNGGSTVASQTVNSGATATKPADPTKSGYTFENWYSDSGLTNAYDFSIAVTADITLYAKWTADAVTLGNDGYPYGNDMGTSQIKLNIVVSSGAATSYKWQKSKTSSPSKPADTEYDDISGATGETLTLSPASGYWYRCVVNDNTYSKAVQAIQPSHDSRTWTLPYGYNQNQWYLSNGTMAYCVPSSGTAFDVVGSFTKNGKSYMLQTSYGGQGWKMYASTNESPDPGYGYETATAPAHIYFAFNENDAYDIVFSVQLGSDQKSFAFGCDTQLGNSATSGSYADYAALEAALNSDNTLKSIAMIGAASPGEAKDTDPAFVISPASTNNLRFWIGNYSGRQTYVFNKTSGSNYETHTVRTTDNGTPTDHTGVTVSVSDVDSGMTMSWVNQTPGSTVGFGFAVGDAKSTGAVSANVDYGNEQLTGLEPNQAYTITYDGRTITVNADGSGNIKLSGKDTSGSDYNLLGETITVTKSEGGASPLTVEVARRPEALPVAVSDDPASKPVYVRDAEISVTKDSITVNIDPDDPNYSVRAAQEYALFNGDEQVGTWVTPVNGQVTFDNLSPGTNYTLKVRVPATSSAPASVASEGTTVKTDADVTITPPAEGEATVNGDGEPHPFPLNVSGSAADVEVAYSKAIDQPYSTTVPSFTAGRQYTVYYRVTASGGVPEYGSFDVTINPRVTFNANGGTLAAGTVSPKPVTYNTAVGAVDAPSHASLVFAGWYADANLIKRWDTENTPVTEDMTLYARWVQSLRNFGFSDSDMESVRYLQLFQGNIAVSEQISVSDGRFSFTGIPDGEYNMVITRSDGKSITVRVSVESNTVSVSPAIPADNINSAVSVGNGAPDVVVGGLDKEAVAKRGDDYIYWDEKYDSITDASGSKVNVSVDLSLRVEHRDDLTTLNLTTEEAAHLSDADQSLRAAQQAIQAKAGTGAALDYLDLSVVKTVYMNDVVADEVAVTETQNVLEIVIPYATQGATPYAYRFHNGAAEVLTALTSRPADNYTDGTFYVGNGFVAVYSRYFSTYAVSPTAPYTPPYVPGSDDGGGSSGSSGPSAPAATTVTVPVSGSGETVHVTVTVTGGSAAVRNDEALLEQVLSDKVATGTVVIDVSGLNATITEAVIPAAMVEKIAEAVAEEHNDVSGMTVKMSVGTVTFDETALAAIAEQMTGNDLRLNLDDVGAAALNTAQQSAIEEMNVEAVYDAYMTSGGVRITDFKGGSATVTVNYPLRDGQKARGVVVWYVADDGSMTQMPMVRGIDEISFVVPHFSHYVLTYDPVLAERPIGPEETGVADWLITDAHIVYFTGYEDGTIRPDGNITRAETAMIFYRLLKNQNVAITVSFSDVTSGAWYAEAVNTLASLGVFTGYEDGSFRPQNPITRAEFVAIATRFARAVGGGMAYSDVPADYWAYGNIVTATAYGWIGGYEDGTFRPANSITRAEAAKIINRMLDRGADAEYVTAHQDKLTRFFDLQDPTKWYYLDMMEAGTEHDFTITDGAEKWNR